jgi:diadenylate cyclase
MSSLSAVHFIDVIDILSVATLIYLLLRLIRGTRGLYMLTGLLICVMIFWIARGFELRTVGWIFGQLLSSLVLVVVVIFQNDIRRLLTKLGRSPYFAPASMQQNETIEELVKTSVSLANKKIGAIIAIERGASINEHVEHGILIDAWVNKDLLTAIFLPVSPLHDGAVVIQGSRIVSVGCLLPLSMSPEAAKAFGTRHRAAIGLAEETDAVVIVVSEERGIISLVLDGDIEENFDANRLRQRLLELFTPSKRFLWYKKWFFFIRTKSR